MRPGARLLCISAAVTVAGLGAFDLAYGRYAQNHFGPNVTLQRAEAAGQGCLVTLGDSRMGAGIDAPVLQHALRERGVDICVAPLAVGALPISGQALALRRLVRDGAKPASVVLGVSTGTLLDEDAPDPSALFGNRAAELAWSEPSDLYRYYPSFPFADLDRGVRFWFARSNAISTYASVMWIKTQVLQERLVGNSLKVPHNRFGSLSNMEALVATFREDAIRKLAASNGRFRLDRWFELMRLVTHQAGARLVVIEVPMRSSYRAEVVHSEAGLRYRAWLESELARSGDVFLDMSAPQSVTDENLGDGIHLDQAGAKAFSAELAAKLVPLLAPADLAMPPGKPRLTVH
jgi:hypothetical protein